MTEDLNKRIATLEMRFAVFEERHTAMSAHVREIRDMIKWITRLILGGMISALVLFAFNGGFIP